MNELSFTEHDSTLRDYIRVMFRQKFVFFISVFTIMPIVVVGLILRTPMYETRVKMLVSGSKQVEATYYKELLGARDTASLTQSEIVISDPILERVVTMLHLYQKPDDYEERFASPLNRRLKDILKKVYPLNKKEQLLSPDQQNRLNYRQAIEDLRKNIQVDPVRDTNIFIIRVKDVNPVGAAVIANVLSRSYIIFDLEQQLAELQLKYGSKHPTVMQLQDNIQRMTNNLSGQPLPDTEAIGPASVKIIEQASVPLLPGGPDKKLVLIMAFFLSIFLGIVLAFVFEYMDQTIKSPRDVETLLKVPFFGSIPRIRSRRNMLMNGSVKRFPRRYAFAFRNLADQIIRMFPPKTVKTILFTATNIREGTSTIVANLGVNLSEYTTQNILILDVNYRNASIHKIFKLPPHPGLVDVLTGKLTLSDAIRNVAPRLSVLCAGETDLNPVTLLDSPKMNDVMKQIILKFDLILIDCTQLKSYQDGYLLSSFVDKIIFVVCENQTRRQAALRVLSSLKECNAPVLGAILNKRTHPIPNFVYERV